MIRCSTSSWISSVTLGGVTLSSVTWLAALAFAAGSLVCANDAAAFAGMVSPARFELKAVPGDKLSQVIEIGNDAVVSDDYLVSTADWKLNAQGGVEYSEALQPSSCRPWVRIERQKVKMGPRALRKFRFEVHVPADAQPQECRFALLVEKAPDNLPQVAAGTIQFPLQGRIGVIVYISIGDVKPQLELRSLGRVQMNGNPTLAATFHNTGNAHGRPEGILEGTDANGKKLEFTVSPFPILPGETRSVAIWPQEEANGKTPSFAYPLRLRGNIEWAGGKQAVDATIK